MKRRSGQPPRLAELCLRTLAPRSERNEILGDLQELYRHRRKTRGPRAASLWYWRQVASFAWGFRDLNRCEQKERRRRGGLSGSIFQDVGFAVRTLLRSRGFTVAALVTLSLGIGANIAIWSVVHHVLLRPLGHPDEARLVQIWPEHRFTRNDYDRYRDRLRSFASLSVFVRTSFTLTGETSPEVVRGVLVSPEHFAVFSRTPALGRDFARADALPGAAPVAIVSYEMWQNELGGTSEILGKRLELGGFEGATRTVIGVAPKAFRPFAEDVDVWAVLEIDPDDEDYSHVANLGLVGRLRPGVDAAAARAEIQTIAAGLEPPPGYLDKIPQYRVASLRTVLVERGEPTLLSLLAAVAIVLLLCCFNVANLLLARSAGREREMQVRLSLGASRFRIARQLATENFVLAAAGASIGLFLAWLGSSFFGKLVPAGVPRTDAIGIDIPVALFSLALTFLTSLLFGWAPVLRLSRGASSLKVRAAGTSRDRSRVNQILVAGEMALSLALVVASALLVKSFWRLSQVESGIRTEALLTLKLLPSTVRYGNDEELYRYYDSVLEALRAVPGVAAAGAIQLLPMTSQFMGVGFSPTGAPIPEGVDPPSTSYRIVTPDYRRALGIPLLEGRDLTESDRRGTEPVGLVNETFAKEVWPNEDPLGRQVRYEDGSPWFTVVGVLGDVHQHRLDVPTEKEVYVPHAQDSWPSVMALVVRTELGADAAFPLLREVIWTVDADVPIRDVRTMSDVVGQSMSEERTRTLLFSAFALLAFVLSAVGVYGVVSYTVSQKQRDIGIRMALGATERRVLEETLASGLKPVAMGIGIGILMALGGTRLLDSLLFRVDATDPTVFSVVGAALSVVAAAAAYLPARRASHLDPVSSLNVDG